MTIIAAIPNEPSTMQAVLEAVRLLAGRTGATLRIVHPRPAVDPGFMPTAEVMTDARRAALARCQDEHSGAIAEIVGGWVGWNGARPVIKEVGGDPAEIALAVAREVDVVVVGTACGEHRVNTAGMINRLLRQDRAAVMVVPGVIPVSVGARVGIAWETGIQLDTAMRSAGSMIAWADTATLLMSVETLRADGEPEILLSDLRARGIDVGLHTFEEGGRHAGRALVAAACGAGCDLLVMAAHHHGRLRELLFGSPSGEVISDPGLPVLLHA